MNSVLTIEQLGELAKVAMEHVALTGAFLDEDDYRDHIAETQRRFLHFASDNNALTTQGIIPEAAPAKTPAKTRWDLMPFRALDEVAKVITHGAEKHSPDGWRDRPRSEHVAAALRHLVAVLAGESSHEDESGRLNLAHAATRLLFLVELDLEDVVEAESAEVQW